MISKRAWGWIGGIVLLALLPLLMMADLRRRADEILERHRRTYEIDRGRWRMQSAERKPLLGPAVAGNAWDCYLPAFDAFKKMLIEEQNACPSIAGSHVKMDPAAFEPVWTRYQPHLEQIRQGVRSTRIDPNYDFEQGFSMELPGITPAMNAVRFLVDGAEFLRMQGRDAEALDLILLALAFSRDIAARGPLVCHLVSIVSRDFALTSLRTLLETTTPAPADLERAAQLLDRLAALPPTLDETTVVDDLVLRTALLKLARGEMGSVHTMMQQISGIGAGPKAAGWLKISRYGFSDRAICAEALNHWQDCRERMLKVASLPPGPREKAIAGITQETTEAGNPLISMLVPSFAGAWKNTARSDAELALARLAIAVARFDAESKAFPASLQALVPRFIARIPVDPISGGTFCLKIDGDTAIVYVFGLDGDDDGGHSILDRNYDSDGDITWTVKRR